MKVSTYYSYKELDTFLDAVREDVVWGNFFYVELTTGLRRGEICGLMWQDFDTRSGVLQVRRTLHSRKLGVDMLGKTKTRSGERTIVLPRITADILRRRKEKSITQWIFPDPVRPELPLSPDCAYTHMKAILHKAGLPDIRFHDLRHRGGHLRKGVETAARKRKAGDGTVRQCKGGRW